MNNSTSFCGIDVSNLTLDVCYLGRDCKPEQIQISNSQKGFELLLKKTGEQCHFVFEATGVYHLHLMFFLDRMGCKYSVVNPVKIKRFIQMKLDRNKSDVKDAKRIHQFAVETPLTASQMPDKESFECKAINNAIQAITDQITAFKNQIHSLDRLPIGAEIARETYQKIILNLQTEIKNLDKILNEKLKQWQPELVELVSSVVGIGKRATAELIIHTRGFDGMENYKQLISYCGLAPVENSSGTSVKGRSRICKQGGEKIRHILYMCAMNSIKNNPQCKTFYDRLVQNGKNKRVALIAVCNKLLKQIFGVVCSKTKYDKNYKKLTT
ncbi:MAG: IS110 family transposase [Arcicella sp.]|nr:IS110 family transposase [Arcicella sp.]